MAMKAKPETKYDRNSIQKAVRDTLTGFITNDRTDFNDETDFIEYEMDTLDTVEFIMKLEEVFNICIDDESSDNCNNITKTVDIIAKILDTENRFIKK